MKQKLGVLLIVSGPSGCGKTTLCRRLRDESHGQVVYSISCTTRPRREGEVQGVDYHFLSVEEFEARQKQGDFLEWAQVHGNFYGTLKSEVSSLLLEGKDVIMDIDVQGAASIREVKDEVIAAAYADVYIAVSLSELERRLRNRETDDAAVIALRLKNAQQENEQRDKYQFSFDSATKDEDYARFVAYIEACRARLG